MVGERDDGEEKTSLQDVQEVAEILAGFDRPWFVSGGWAIDLFLGAVTRHHEDLEVGIFREDQRRLRDYLAGWSFEKVDVKPEGNEWTSWPDDEWLDLPIFQVRTRPDHACPVFEIFLNETTGDHWRFRRVPSITRPRTEIPRWTANGIPYVTPEVQLLYKARLHRPKDEHDFKRVLPGLDEAQRAWLIWALEIFIPGDPWLAEISRAGDG